MTAFRFPLQALLDLRDAEERQGYGELLAATRSHTLARERATQLGRERATIVRSFGEANARLAPDFVRETYLMLDLVAAASARQDRVVDLAREQEMTCRVAFVAARQEHRRIGALRDRAYAAFVDDIERREADVLDAANAAKHNATILVAQPFHNWAP